MPGHRQCQGSDPAFSVPVVSNPIPNEAIKDLEIVEDQGRWLVSDKALEQYGIREADHAKGTYWFRLPKARNGSTAWQNENVQLTLPGRCQRRPDHQYPPMSAVHWASAMSWATGRQKRTNSCRRPSPSIRYRNSARCRMRPRQQ